MAAKNVRKWAPADAIGSLRSLKVYGNPLDGFDASAFNASAVGGGKVVLARVRAVAFGANCKVFPFPVLLVLPDSFEDPDPDDGCAKSGEAVWSLAPDFPVASLDMKTGLVGDILDEAATRGISGGLRLENPRISNGRACVTIHAWAKIEVFGASVGFNERHDVCIPLEGCHTVWEWGIGNVQICVRAGSRGTLQLCGKLCVGKWGLSHCWEECTTVGVRSQSLEDCSSPGKVSACENCAGA